MANQNIIEKQQVRGSSASIAKYAGKEGQIVFNRDNKRLHVMSGTAGQSTQYLSTAQAATKTQLGAKLDASTYNSEKTSFATKSQISTLATKAEVTSGLANKVNTSTYNADKATFALKTQIPDTSGLATKTQLSGYATTTALTQGLAGKANATHTHEIANVADLQTTLDGKIPKTGSAGTLKTTETITAGGSAFAVGPSQPQSYSASDGATITVQDGTASEGWITTVALAGSATVNFGSNWAYVGSAPTLAKGLLTFAWRGAFGVIQFSKFGE